MQTIPKQEAFIPYKALSLRPPEAPLHVEGRGFYTQAKAETPPAPLGVFFRVSAFRALGILGGLWGLRV